MISNKLKKILLVALTALLPVSVAVSQNLPSCIAVNVSFPKGSSVSIMNQEVAAQLGDAHRRTNARIYNEYLDRVYSTGGTAFDWRRSFEAGQGIINDLRFDLHGRRGGHIIKTVDIEPFPFDVEGFDAYQAILEVPEIIIGGEGLPPDLSAEDFDDEGIIPSIGFPIPCPRLASARYLYRDMGNEEIDPDVVTNAELDWYEGLLDTGVPPGDIRMNRWVWHMSCANQEELTNVLCINQATVTYDWEAEGLFVGQKEDGEVLTEAGMAGGLFAGGVYANFHYVTVPCKEEYRRLYQNFQAGLNGKNTPEKASELMLLESRNPNSDKYSAYRSMQILLHLARKEGDYGLEELDPNEVRGLLPQLWAHGMLPGPFQTKIEGRGHDYNQCEWLDTAHQSPSQTMNYRNYCIWDWDSDPGEPKDQCAMILMYEGDGFSTLGARSLEYIGETDISDDFIGLFEVRRQDTINGNELTVKNYSNDVTLKLSTYPAIPCR